MPGGTGWRITWWLLGVALLAAACGNDLRDPTGVGDHCTPSDEYDPAFAGYSAEEMNLDFGPHHNMPRIDSVTGQTVCQQPGGAGCIGNAELVSRCDDAHKRILRFVGDPTMPVPAKNSTVILACQGVS